MEKSIHISSIDKLDEIEVKKYSRIYIGADSCPNLLPFEKELEQFFDFAKNNKLKITLLTSFCYQIHLDKFKSIIYLLEDYSKFVDLEIVINDWGIFQLIKDKNFKLVLGRLLSKQKKGPRVQNIKNNVSPIQFNIFGEVHCEFFEDFLIKNNFIRIELDNNSIGINYNGRLPASLYFPFIFVSPSSFCIFNGKISKEKNCKKECLRNFLVLDDDEFNSKQYRKGNSFFYKNKQLPLNKNNIDRVVLFQRV